LSIPVTVVESVRAGVAPPDDAPANPFAEATDTPVTVPAVPLSVVPLKERPVPKVIADGAAGDPVGLPRSVLAAIEGVLEFPLDDVFRIQR
jgi:hypothetical protein